MKQMPIVGVFGLSGVGKSWLISHCIWHFSALHVQASQLLREAKAAISGQEMDSEELRKGAVLDNQAILVAAFARIRKAAMKPIVFDGHCVVDNGVQLLEVLWEVIGSLKISNLIFVRASAKDIIERRRNDVTRVRPVRSEAEIEFHQLRAEEVCKAYSTRLGLPFTIVNGSDNKCFCDALEDALFS